MKNNSQLWPEPALFLLLLVSGLLGCNSNAKLDKALEGESTPVAPTPGESDQEDGTSVGSDSGSTKKSGSSSTNKSGSGSTDESDSDSADGSGADGRRQFLQLAEGFN